MLDLDYINLNYNELIDILKRYLEKKENLKCFEIEFSNKTESIPDGYGFYDEIYHIEHILKQPKI